MTHATFNASLVKQAASKALEERQRLPNQDEKIGRLGELVEHRHRSHCGAGAYSGNRPRS